MSGSHHDEQHQSNPVKLAIGIAIGTVALIISIIMLVQYAVTHYGTRVEPDDPSMSAEAISKRLAPVARVAIDPNAQAAPAQAPAAAAPAPAAASAPAAPVPAAAKK